MFKSHKIKPFLMKFFILFSILLIILASHRISSSVSAHHFSDEIIKAYDDYKETFEKSLPFNSEINLELETFAKDYNSIQEHNNLFSTGNETYCRKINRFSCMTLQQKRENLNGLRIARQSSKF